MTRIRPFAFAACTTLLGATAAPAQVRVTSPDGRNQVSVEVREGRVAYRVDRDGRAVAARLRVPRRAAPAGWPAHRGYVTDKTTEGHSHWSQHMVRHYRKVIETAARCGIMLDVHEPVLDTPSFVPAALRFVAEIYADGPDAPLARQSVAGRDLAAPRRPRHAADDRARARRRAGHSHSAGQITTPSPQRTQRTRR